MAGVLCMYDMCIAQTRVPQLGRKKLNTRHFKHKLASSQEKHINFVCVSQHKANILMFWFREMTHSVHQQH